MNSAAISRLAAALGAAALCLATLPGARADEYDTLRTKWAGKLAGGSFNVADSDVANQLATLSSNAQANWTDMNKASDRSALWTDLANWTPSATVTNSYARLEGMATAYVTPNSSLYHNATLAADIVAALDWMNANHYYASLTFYDNWWDWQIGTPKILGNIMTTMYDQLSAGQLASYIAAIDHFVPDPTVRLKPDGSAQAAPETGANLLDKAVAVVVRGIVGKSSAKLAQGRDAISPALPYVTSGDGFYLDGSFIQHTYVPYVGGYGGPLIADIAQLYYLLNGSSWSVTDANAGNAYAWALNAYAPLVYNGAMLDMVRGRGVSRQFSTDHYTGRSIVASLAEFSQGLPSDQAGVIKSMLKGWMQRDSSFGASYFTPVPTANPGIYSGMGLYDMSLLKAILNDSSIAAAAEPVRTHVFASMDRVVQREAGFALGLSLFSNRISAFEYGNGENIKGWWSGIGMLNLYNSDLTQYDGGYWPTVDAWRLPGTTTDHSGSGTPVAWKNYSNPRNLVGGAELGGRYAAVGMDFATLNLTGSSLAGKKAWFLFGDRIVAVGSGIASSSGASVETIAENRKLNAAGDNQLTVNGVAKSSAASWSEAMTAVQWAHLAGSASGADIGYYFPDQPAVNGLRESRSGTWHDINTGGSTDTVSNTFLSLALPHGVNPGAGAYTYVILPNRSASETAAYAAAPTISVLERSTSATAVRDKALGLVGAIFWADASKTINLAGLPYLTCDKKAAVVTQQAGTDLQLSVADPTQANSGVINLELNRAAVSLVSADAGVTVTQLSPTIKLAINVNLAAGKSFTARFTLSNAFTLYPTDDAYIRDGSYAATNYGSTNTMYLKNDAAGYQRKGLLKFNLDVIQGSIDSATLKLNATSSGTTGMTHNLYSTGDSWSETSVTWNSRPANGALAASWAAPAAGSAVQIPLSAVAASAQTGDQLLSLGIEAASNYGNNGWAEYASKDNANMALRPTLVVTYH